MASDRFYTLNYDEPLFSSHYLGDLLRETFGFSYEDFCSVRDAIARVHGEKFFAIRDTVGEMFHQRDAKRNEPEYKREARAAVMSMMELPGERATLTVREIAEASGVPTDRTQAVMDRFSLSFNGADDALAAVKKFLSGNSPFRSASLVKDIDGNYIRTGKPIGTDCFRQVVEEALKAFPSRFRRYEKRRMLVSEQLALKRLAVLLGSEAAHANLKYFRVNPDVDFSRLGPDAENINSIAEQTEADGLFIIEDVAICVEVKAMSISGHARRGEGPEIVC